MVVAVAISPRNTGTPHFHGRTLPISSISTFARLYWMPPRAAERAREDRRDLGISWARILLWVLRSEIARHVLPRVPQRPEQYVRDKPFGHPYIF